MSDSMPFYDVGYLDKICAEVFGRSFELLDEAQRKIVREEIEVLDSDRTVPSPRGCAWQLRDHIGGPELLGFWVRGRQHPVKWKGEDLGGFHRTTEPRP